MKKYRKKLGMFLADTLPMVVLATLAGLFNELLIANMSFEQVVHARSISVLVNIFTARPYGMYRDWVFEFLKDEATGVSDWICDCFAFISFQIPVYVVTLKLSGASLEQIMIASIVLTLVSTIVGRVYGIFLDFSRRIFRHGFRFRRANHQSAALSS